jgi:hypothetical protein
MNASELALQTRRRANLRHLLQSLDREGVQSWTAQGAILANMTGLELRAMMEGALISNALAREIEWSMHRPDGWLDGQPEDTLDD